MATTTNISQTFAGDDAIPYISKALLSGDTLANDLLTVYTDIKKKRAIKKLDYTNIIQAFSCDWAPTGNLAIGEVILEPFEFKVNLSHCYNDFKSTWDAARMKAGVNKTDLPFQSYLVDQVSAHVAQEVERMIWQGDSDGSTGTSLDFIDGLLKQLYDADTAGTAAVADPKTVNVDVDITAANVLAFTAEAYGKIPDEIAGADDLVMVVSKAFGAAYRQAIAAAYKNDQTQNPPLVYLDLPIFAVGGMPRNKFVIYRKSNMFFGTDLVSDFNEVIVKDMREIDLSDNLRIKVQGTLDVAIGYVTEIVVGRPTK